jgi:predicted branched-subunit amino acid permease
MPVKTITAAGSLVLLGVILAWRLHPAFIALSAFVGAGLIFAGATDFRGMAMLLGKMPWNRRV